MRVARHIVVLTLFVCLSLAFAGKLLSSQAEYEPPDGKGRVVVVISGQSGPGSYRDIAKDLAGKGYFVVLVDGNRLLEKGRQWRGPLERGHYRRAAVAPRPARQGSGSRVFAGGASSRSFAARRPKLVSAVVVYYPATAYIKDPGDFVSKIKVPTLMFAGALDDYKNCCRIETARRLADAAKVTEGKALLQVVEYPEAGHGFNIKFGKEWRADD